MISCSFIKLRFYDLRGAHRVDHRRDPRNSQCASCIYILEQDFGFSTVMLRALMKARAVVSLRASGKLWAHHSAVFMRP